MSLAPGDFLLCTNMTYAAVCMGFLRPCVRTLCRGVLGTICWAWSVPVLRVRIQIQLQSFENLPGRQRAGAHSGVCGRGPGRH